MLTRIQQELIAINDAKFSKICQQYLSYQYDSVMAPGFVLAKEKSKPGTPDILIALENTYVMCEVTTQADGLEKKLQKDIDHCLKQDVIPLAKILKVILFCNSKVPPALHSTLQDYKNEINARVPLEIIDVDDLSVRILKNYNAIIRTLGIPIDTNQIFEPAEFVGLYEKSGFAISLKNRFYNRQAELEMAMGYLESSDILVLHGEPGVGKTKFSLELSTLLRQKQANCLVKYIAANGNLSIWDDLTIQLHQGHDYILVLDDANKLRFNLEHIINFKKGFSGSIRIIITVRNYVSQSVTSQITDYRELEIKLFTHGELQNILSSPEFDISQHYIDRIYSISKGNPRLALMCYHAGLDEGPQALENAGAIYEKYFSSILESTGGLLEGDDSLKVAAILALYRGTNIKSKENLEELQTYFGIPQEKFIEICIALNQHEIAEEYRDTYKISDQILGEYMVYKVFIDKKILPFKALIDLSFTKRRFSLLHLITPIFNNYGYEDIKKRTVTDIRDAWKQIATKDSALRFLKDFWFYIPSETLVYLKGIIDRVPTTMDGDYVFGVYKDNNIEYYGDEIFETLVHFRQLPEKFDMAQELLLQYGLKNNVLFSKYLKVLTQGFSFDNESHLIDYGTQIKVLNFLHDKATTGELLYSRILLFIAPTFLKSTFQTVRNIDNSMYIGENNVLLTDNQVVFRKKLLGFIFKSFKNAALEEAVYHCLEGYIRNIDFRCNKPIINFDGKSIVRFFKANFSKDNYTHCFIVQHYCGQLKLMDIKFDKALQAGYIERRYELYLVLNEDRHKMKEYRGNHENYQNYKRNELKKWTADYTLKNYIRLFDDIEYILVEDRRFERDVPIRNSITVILELLAAQDNDLFFKVLKMLFRYSFSKNLVLQRLFSIAASNSENAARLRKLLNADVVGRNNLLGFWYALPSRYFVKQDLSLLKKGITQGTFTYFGNLDDILLKLEGLIPSFEAEAEILLDLIITRSKSENKINLHTGLYNYLENKWNNLFIRRLEDLQYLYLYLDESNYFDHDVKIFRLLLKYDMTFIRRFLKVNFDTRAYYTKKQINESNLHKLWKFEGDIEELFTIILDHFKDHTLLSSDYSAEIASVFKGTNEAEIRFLTRYLEKSKDQKAIRLAFNIGLTVYKENKLQFLDIILKKPDNLELFKKLPLHVRSSMLMAGSGSDVPRLRNNIKEMESFKQHLEAKNDLQLLEHIAYLEEKIDFSNTQAERIKQDELLDNWG